MRSITLLSCYFGRKACLCTGIHSIKKAVQRNNKLRNVSVLFVENSEHASGKTKSQPSRFDPIHSLTDSHSHTLKYTSKLISSLWIDISKITELNSSPVFIWERASWTQHEVTITFYNPLRLKHKLCGKQLYIYETRCFCQAPLREVQQCRLPLCTRQVKK